MITVRLSDDLLDDSIGDILEFESLLSGTTGLPFAQLRRRADAVFAEDYDPDSNTESETDDGEVFFLKCLGILRDRARRVGDTYPFVLNEETQLLVLKSDPGHAEYVYLFCLILSHPSADHVLTGIYKPTIGNRERNLFQACSTVATAGFVGGNAVSFGFPRPDHTGFRTKLNMTFESIADGRLRQVSLPGTPRDVKDGEIDIVSWTKRDDANKLKSYLLAQVASGFDWKDKPLQNNTIDTFHRIWFEVSPSIPAMTGIVIPFIPAPFDDETIDEYLKIWETRYGHILFRLTLPREVKKGIALSSVRQVEGIEALDQIRTWVQEEVQKANMSAIA